MGHGIKLRPAEWDALDGLRFTTPSADVFRNCLIILMSDSASTIASIAKTVGCSSETVKRIRKLYRLGGIDALYPIVPPGRKTRATPRYLEALKKAVQSNPLDLGYGFSVWSSSRLAAHLGKTTGVRYSEGQMRRILKQQGYSFHRPKHTLKGKRDEAAYEKARRQLARLKKTP
jgi:transposase